MEKELLKIVRELKGNMLGIGIENDSIIEAINQNNKIVTCYLLENKNKGSKFISKKKSKKAKKVNIKKLKKYFAKKRMETIICDYSSVKKFMRNFVPGSIYINNDKLYVYNVKAEDLDDVKRKYQRYTNDIEVKEINDMYIVIINNQKSRNGFIKDKKYFIIDLFESIIEVITDVLIN